ncbi:MAG: A/G-specific adenine glycosylase [Syntrophomonadaceae bacterium]|nr:A/G-specific adenine glycosylase [Syntrophomonadaceae bacterium]
MKNRAVTSFDMLEAGQAQGLPLLAEPLLAWYGQNSRALPWREQPEPYWVWTSEIMLQQTRLNVVLPYFHRFVECLPDIPALAKAEENLLLKVWEGLGYYNRVRNMQKAARIMVEHHSGRLPASYQQLLALPGIGEYTAGAIASIAYQIPVPAVDGNVLRVMARLLGCRADIAQPRVRKTLRAAVEAMLPGERPGDFNQAMMDLGAMVCLPHTSPACTLCPLRAMCVGYQEGIADRLPVKSSPKPRAVQQKTVLVLISQGKTLLRQRPTAGLLAGLWEFPTLDGWLSEENVALWLNEWGICPLSVTRVEESRHVFTHVEWQMQGYLVYAADAPAVPDGLWVDESAVHAEYAVPSAFKSFTKHLAQWLE